MNQNCFIMIQSWDQSSCLLRWLKGKGWCSMEIHANKTLEWHYVALSFYLWGKQRKQRPMITIRILITICNRLSPVIFITLSLLNHCILQWFLISMKQWTTRLVGVIFLLIRPLKNCDKSVFLWKGNRETNEHRKRNRPLSSLSTVGM